MNGPARGAGALLLALTGAGTLTAQHPNRGLRNGPHQVARLRVRSGVEVWYPGSRATGTPDSGTFPLLVYAVPPGDGDAVDTALVRYFASHGYVVAWGGTAQSVRVARAAAGTLAFVDRTRSALLAWDGARETSETGTGWGISVEAPREAGGIVRVVASSDGARGLAFRLPATGTTRRLAASVGHLLMDAVLRRWGEGIQAIAARLEAMGLRQVSRSGP